MIDIKKVKKIIKERKKLSLYDEFGLEKKWKELLEALGNDEEEVYNFLMSIDDELKPWIEEIYEEITEKFPTERIEDAFILNHIH